MVKLETQGGFKSKGLLSLGEAAKGSGISAQV